MEDMLQDILVAGEVSGASRRGDALYFTLKDKFAQIQAVCFGIGKTYVPENGESVIVRGSVEFYAGTGKTNFNVYSITPEGKGEDYLKLQQLKNKLEQKGYFLAENKKKLPFFIKKVCIITSISGAVIQDILRTVLPEVGILDITVVDSRVQGKDSTNSIINAIKESDDKGYDVIIVARGGGSAENLAAFNDEELLDAVFEADTPIISAVGHETDYTLIDYVADVRALTPTAAGKILVENYKSVVGRLSALKSELSAAVEYEILMLHHELTERKNALQSALSDLIDGKEHRLSLLKAKLVTLNPERLLKTGYAVVEKDGKRLSLSRDVEVGDELVLRFSDGDIRVKVVE